MVYPISTSERGLESQEPLRQLKAQTLEGGAIKHAIMNMTDEEVFDHINKLRLDSYSEGYRDALYKESR